MLYITFCLITSKEWVPIKSVSEPHPPATGNYLFDLVFHCLFTFDIWRLFVIHLQVLIYGSSFVVFVVFRYKFIQLIIIDGPVQDCSISSALALKILQIFTKPSLFPSSLLHWRRDNATIVPMLGKQPRRLWENIHRTNHKELMILTKQNRGVLYFIIWKCVSLSAMDTAIQHYFRQRSSNTRNTPITKTGFSSANMFAGQRKRKWC